MTVLGRANNGPASVSLGFQAVTVPVWTPGAASAALAYVTGISGSRRDERGRADPGDARPQQELRGPQSGHVSHAEQLQRVARAGEPVAAKRTRCSALGPDDVL